MKNQKPGAPNIFYLHIMEGFYTTSLDVVNDFGGLENFIVCERVSK